MFLSSRGDFKEYLQTNKKPFMANFYKIQRIKFNILMKSKNEPLGGKWSFDEDNRNKLDPKVNIVKQSFSVGNVSVVICYPVLDKKSRWQLSNSKTLS